MIVSIIIPTYNEEKYIERCIDSLENQTISTDEYEIIVIDGNSKDSTMEKLLNFKNRYNNIKIFSNPNKIQSISFNMGIKEARADYIIMIGAHSEYPKDFIEKNIKSITSEDVDCVGGKIIMKGINKTGELYGAVRNTAFGGGLSPYRYSNKKQFVETVAFGCYKREILDRVNGFNENLVKNSDNDLNKRIIMAGGKILFDPEITFYYFSRDSIKGIYKQLFNYGYWEAKLIKQEREQFRISTIVPSVFVVYTIIAIIMALQGNFIALLLEFVPYLLLFMYFAIKSIIPKKLNVFMALFLYLLIHFSIGIGFIIGLF